MDSIRAQRTFCTQPGIPTKALKKVPAVTSVKEENTLGLRKRNRTECKGVIGVMMVCQF